MRVDLGTEAFASLRSGEARAGGRGDLRTVTARTHSGALRSRQSALQGARTHLFATPPFPAAREPGPGPAPFCTMPRCEEG